MLPESLKEFLITGGGWQAIRTYLNMEHFVFIQHSNFEIKDILMKDLRCAVYVAALAEEKRRTGLTITSAEFNLGAL